MKNVVGQKGKKIAAINFPKFSLEIGNIYDMVSPIYFGDLLLHKHFEPTVYYWVKEHENFYYIGYCLFHRKDTNHELDFEGVVLQRHKNNLALRINSISIFHYAFLYKKTHISNNFFSPKGSHGFYSEPRKITSNVFELRKANLINMQLKKFPWEKYKEIFNKHNVKMPDQWDSREINRIYQWGKRHRVKTKGLIYTRPDLVFKWCNGQRKEVLSELKESKNNQV